MHDVQMHWRTYRKVFWTKQKPALAQYRERSALAKRRASCESITSYLRRCQVATYFVLARHYYLKRRDSFCLSSKTFQLCISGWPQSFFILSKIELPGILRRWLFFHRKLNRYGRNNYKKRIHAFSTLVTSSMDCLRTLPVLRLLLELVIWNVHTFVLTHLIICFVSSLHR